MAVSMTKPTAYPLLAFSMACREGIGVDYARPIMLQLVATGETTLELNGLGQHLGGSAAVQSLAFNLK